MTDTQDAIRQAHAITSNAGLRAEATLKVLRREMEALDAEYQKLMGELSHYKDIDSQEARDFLKEPWCIHPRGKEEWLIFVPKFIGVQVGWLERTTETFNVFCVNRYAHWLGNIPPELRDELKLPPPFESEVEGRTLRTKVVLPDDVKEHVAERTGPGEYRVKKGHKTHPTKGGHWGPVKTLDLGYTVFRVRSGFCHSMNERCVHLL